MKDVQQVPRQNISFGAPLGTCRMVEVSKPISPELLVEIEADAYIGE